MQFTSYIAPYRGGAIFTMSESALAADLGAIYQGAIHQGGGGYIRDLLNFRTIFFNQFLLSIYA